MSPITSTKHLRNLDPRIFLTQRFKTLKTVHLVPSKIKKLPKLSKRKEKLIISFIGSKEGKNPLFLFQPPTIFSRGPLTFIHTYPLALALTRTHSLFITLTLTHIHLYSVTLTRSQN